MSKKLLKGLLNLVNRKQTNILSAATIIMGTVFASRTLGLVRDRLLAGRFVPAELGVYFASFRLPNLLFEVLVIGTVSTAFIPVFSNLLAEGEKKHAFRVASAVINMAGLIMGTIAAVILLFAPRLLPLLTPGFSTEQTQQMVFFTRIFLAAQIFPLLLGNFATGILQSYKHFFLPALAPIVYNLGTIFGILFLTPYFGLTGVVGGVVLGAFLFFAIQIPQLKKLGYRHFFSFNRENRYVRRIFKLAGPRTLSLGIAQIDSTVDLILASLLGASSVAVFTFAQHLQQVPVGMFGLTIAQATLPTLSQKAALKHKKEFTSTFLSSWHQIMFLVLPASVILIVLRIPVVRLVFGAQQFDWNATVLTGMTLSFFAVSLFAQATAQLLIRSFFALQDSTTPVITSTFSVFLNTILSIFFILGRGYPVWALGLSASIASFVNAGLLFFFLYKRLKGMDLYQIIIPPAKMFLAAGITGVWAQTAKRLLDQLVFDTTRTFELILFTGTVAGVGLLIYAFMSWFLNIKEVLTFYNMLKRVIRVRDLILDTGPELISGEETL